MNADADDPMSSRSSELIHIADLRPYMKSVNVVAIVLEKGAPSRTKDSHSVVQFKIADATGSVLLTLWDDYAATIQPGDILQLTGGYCTLFRHSLRMYAGKQGSLRRIGEFTMLFSETPDVSEIQWVPDPSNAKALLPSSDVPGSAPVGPSSGAKVSPMLSPVAAGASGLGGPGAPPSSAPGPGKQGHVQQQKHQAPPPATGSATGRRPSR